MDIKFSKANRTLIAHMIGEIDHHSSEYIKDKIEKTFLNINAKNLIFDFEKVSFMDSSGVGMIIGRYKWIKTLDGLVAISCVNQTIDRIFSVSGLYKIIPVHQTIEQALETMKGEN